MHDKYSHHGLIMKSFFMSKIKHCLRKTYKESLNENDKGAYDSYKLEFKSKVSDKKHAFILTDPCDSPTNNSGIYDHQANKNVWSFIKSDTKCSKIPEVTQYKGRYRSNTADQSNIYNNFFCDQFSVASNYTIKVDKNCTDCLEMFTVSGVYNYL